MKHKWDLSWRHFKIIFLKSNPSIRSSILTTWIYPPLLHMIHSWTPDSRNRKHRPKTSGTLYTAKLFKTSSYIDWLRFPRRTQIRGLPSSPRNSRTRCKRMGNGYDYREERERWKVCTEPVTQTFQSSIIFSLTKPEHIWGNVSIRYYKNFLRYRNIQRNIHYHTHR